MVLASRRPRPPSLCAARRGRRAALSTVLAAAGLLAACDHGDAHEPRGVAELRAMVAADSAAGDSAALASLPPALQPVLRLEPYLTAAYLAATPDAECLVLGDDDARLTLPVERRRVRLRLPDSSALVVYVRADPASAALRLVQIVRNPVDGQQRGYIWEGESDATVEARWPRSGRGRPEHAPQPRGGPVPRAVRALGRRVLALPCTHDTTEAPARDAVDAESTAMRAG